MMIKWNKVALLKKYLLQYLDESLHLKFQLVKIYAVDLKFKKKSRMKLTKVGFQFDLIKQCQCILNVSIR
jgi:hypothetical protein